MNLAIQKAELFKQDFANQFGWYVDEAGPDVARRFQVALDNSLKKVAQQPDLGSRRRFKTPNCKDSALSRLSAHSTNSCFSTAPRQITSKPGV